MVTVIIVKQRQIFMQTKSNFVMKFKSFNCKTKTFWVHLFNVFSSTKWFRYTRESNDGVNTNIKWKIKNNFVKKLNTNSFHALKLFSRVIIVRIKISFENTCYFIFIIVLYNNINILLLLPIKCTWLFKGKNFIKILWKLFAYCTW